MAVAIIGAGVAGLACAEVLAANGVAVRLFDKGRSPGGRMASRGLETALGTAVFDHGTQYITARSRAFRAQMQRWAAAGVAAPWPSAGPDAWVGTPTMNAIPRHMVLGQDISLGVRIHGIARAREGWHLVDDGRTSGPYDAVVVALPAEQAATMLGLQDLIMARVAVEARSAPCWALMCAFAEPLLGPDIWRDQGIISWATRNNSKPGRSGPDAWTVHASAEWSRSKLELEPDVAGTELLHCFKDVVGTDATPIVTSVHRWRFALSGSAGTELLWDDNLALGACGDWLLGPRVEAAWLSGRRLARQILAGEQLVLSNDRTVDLATEQFVAEAAAQH